VDAQSRRIFDVNPFLTDLLGYSRDDLVGKELWEIGLSRDVEASKAAFRVLQEGGYRDRLKPTRMRVVSKRETLNGS
jgi:two-component system cell cycle sensor histidine kinase/response regulator CckA